jgi:uncharacterized protein YbjT (DUF2867 family)
MLRITVGTGFIGGYVLEALDERMPRGRVRVLARSNRDLEKLRSQGYDVAAGTVTDLEEVGRWARVRLHHRRVIAQYRVNQRCVAS